MTNAEEVSYRLYVALDSLERVFQYVESRTEKYAAEIESFRSTLEEIADDMLRIAAERGWHRAWYESSFQPFWAQYETFANAHWSGL